jgi:hypothetical protein
MNFAKHHSLFERFSALIQDSSADPSQVSKWARFLTVAQKDEIESIVDAMELDKTMIHVLTQNLDEKLALVDTNADESKWSELFLKEKSYLELQGEK